MKTKNLMMMKPLIMTKKTVKYFSMSMMCGAETARPGHLGPGPPRHRPHHTDSEEEEEEEEEVEEVLD